MAFILCRDENDNTFEVSEITIARFPGQYTPAEPEALGDDAPDASGDSDD